MRHLTLAFALIFSFTALAQTPPEAINYNGVARDANGDPVADATIGLQLTIMQGDPISGTAVYAETHTTTTDAFGLFNVAIGFGTATSGTFAAIDWSMGDHHLAVALDISSGNNYLAMGSTQLLSVPYALYARSAGNQQYQTLSLSNDTLYLTNGGFVVLPPTNWTPNAFPTPVVTTLPATNVNTTYVYFSGSVSGVSSEDIVERGIVYSTQPTPSLRTQYPSNYPYNNGDERAYSLTSGVGTFDCLAASMEQLTVYYYRAYAVTSNHLVFYGNELSLTTTQAIQSAGSGVSFNGYTYPSVVYGNGQEWMTENLRTSRFANGDTIPHFLEGMGVPMATPAYTHYDFDNSFNAVYGKVYNHYAVMDSRNVCPTGWHVPTSEESNDLRNYWDNLANALKAPGNTYWNSPSNGTNESGFSALPSGKGEVYTNGDIDFIGMGGNFYMWTSTQNGTFDDSVNILRLSDSGSVISISNAYRNEYLSIRCIKD
jgi:uncharacterized protein (TIGR02145 family)